MRVIFRPSAFKHGYGEGDFYAVLASRPIRRRSLRGVRNVYEVFGQNMAGDYLHILYRKTSDQIIVFHIHRMTKQQQAYYKRHKR